MTARPAQPGRGDLRPFACTLAACLVLLAVALWRMGLPIDAWTVGALAGGLFLTGASLLRVPTRTRWKLACMPLLFHLALHWPWESTYLQDLRGGRVGVRLQPLELRFGRDGPNTALLERALGPLPAEWRHHCIRSMLLSDWRDGNERVNSRNLIRYEELPAILAKLPHDAAREQTLACLTDPDNLVRIHQCLLLACVWALDYPRGMDASSWWERHAWAFRVERDPHRAVVIFQGWTATAGDLVRFLGKDDPRTWLLHSLVRAAELQERGGWGADRELMAAMLEGVPPGGFPRPDGEIVWWPGLPGGVLPTSEADGNQ